MTEIERMEEALTETEEQMDRGTTAAEAMTVRTYSPSTTRELLQDLSEYDWANTATPPLGSSRTNLATQLGSQSTAMGMVFSSDEI